MNRISATAIALGAVIVTPGTGSALEAVSFGTNWVAQPEHGGFYQAVADGTYEACGLDVTIVPGGPQVNNRALMMAGKIDFYMGGDLLRSFAAIEQGVPLITVAAIFQKHPQVILTHPGAAETWDDLKDLRLIISESGFQTFYQWMMNEYGFTEEQREPYTFNPAPFLADEGMAMQGYLSSEPYVIEREGGFVPQAFLIADAGFSTYATTVETMTQTISERPEVVECFVEGSIEGWYNYLYNDPSAGNALIKEANPEMSDDKIAFAIEKMNEYGIVDSGEALERGIGVMTAEKVQDFYDKMVAAGIVEGGLDTSKTFTTEFVGKGHGMDLKP